MSNRIEPLPPTLSERLNSQTHVVSITSALKEVVQNSIDAKATTITIQLNLYSMHFVVIDNGIGLLPAELDLIGRPNVTSKLKRWNQIKNVKTYGFRGNALHSISEVSKITIITKVKNYNSSWLKLPDSEASLPVRQ